MLLRFVVIIITIIIIINIIIIIIQKIRVDIFINIDSYIIIFIIYSY